LIDERLLKLKTELKGMERIYSGEEVEDSTNEKSVMFASRYLLTVLENAENVLTDTLSEIESGEWSKFEQDGIHRIKNKVLSDLQDIRLAMTLLKKHISVKEE
jgi:hypothetical protein